MTRRLLNMKEKSLILKISKSLFIEQLKWSPWFISIMFLLHLIVSYFQTRIDFTLNSLFGFSYYSTNIYMLIIGIIAGAYFLPFYVKHGITRKNYFIGATLSALGLSAAIATIFAILSFLEGAILWFFGIERLTTTILTVNSGNYWLLSFLVYTLNIFTYYLIGWLITTGYYRFGWKIGFGFIALAILSSIAHGFLWENELYQQFVDKLPAQIGGLSLLISILLTTLLNCLILCIIRLSTRKVAIKL